MVVVGFNASGSEAVSEGAVFSFFDQENALYEITAVNNGRDFQIRKYHYKNDTPNEILVPTLGLNINSGSRIEMKFEVPLEESGYPSSTGPLGIYASVDGSDYVLLYQNLIDGYGLNDATFCLGTRANLGYGRAAQGMEIRYARGYWDRTVPVPQK